LSQICLEGILDVKEGSPKTRWDSRRQQAGAPLASLFTLAVFLAASPLAQGQEPSPPAASSSASATTSQSSSGAESTPSDPGAVLQVQASLIHQVAPVYPQVAKTAHISGTVRLHCIIGKDGTVQSVKYVSGPPLLMKSAMDAVRQWQYQPTVINGKKVEVQTMVSVAFTLDGPPPAATSAQASESSPVARYKKTGYVNDFAGVIDSQDQSRLDSISKDLDQKTEIQMAFVTIESLEGQTAKDFAMDLANLWGLGHKETNRGLLILIAVDDQLYRISVSRGLEAAMPDDEADRLGREMLPMLKNADYGKALLHLAESIQLEMEQQFAKDSK
jgi:TonB family protein